MFQLEQAIEKWKKACNQGEAVSKNATSELESHLRDSIERLHNSGLSEEEAFLIARHRLGSPIQIHEEFSKVHLEQIWLKRSLLALSGYLVVSLILKLINVGQSLASIACLSLGWDSTFEVMGIPLHPGGLVFLLSGIGGALAVIWLISSLSRGSGLTVFRKHPRIEAKAISIIQNTSKRTVLLLITWAATHVIALVIQAAMYRQIDPNFYGELATYHFVAYPIVIISLFGFSAFLHRRYKQLV